MSWHPTAGEGPFPGGVTRPGDHLRNVFYRMGFGDQEIVALSGQFSLPDVDWHSFLHISGQALTCFQYSIYGPGITAFHCHLPYISVDGVRCEPQKCTAAPVGSTACVARSKAWNLSASSSSKLISQVFSPWPFRQMYSKACHRHSPYKLGTARVH